MTKEERAKKWFSNISGAESISIETKIEICNKVAKKMMIIILGLLTLEFILLFMVGGEILTNTADLFNSILEGRHTRNHYIGVALVGVIVFLPVLIIPLTVAFKYKNKCLKSELTKIVTSMKNSDRKEPPLTSSNEESMGDILHFDNLNFKLAIIQVLMYDLEVLKPAFDIFDFSEEFSELDIDTESTELVEPALEYFKNLQISQKYASLVKEIDMDGGNEIFMNLIPQWDGEDSIFDLNEVSLAELKQFPNLKQATIMSSNFEQVKETFAAAGVDVELV